MVSVIFALLTLIVFIFAFLVEAWAVGKNGTSEIVGAVGDWGNQVLTQNI
jgi:hypothetical protein